MRVGQSVDGLVCSFVKQSSLFKQGTFRTPPPPFRVQKKGASGGGRGGAHGSSVRLRQQAVSDIKIDTRTFLLCGSAVSFLSYFLPIRLFKIKHNAHTVAALPAAVLLEMEVKKRRADLWGERREVAGCRCACGAVRCGWPGAAWPSMLMSALFAAAAFS